jgi:hypothetical protein
MYKEDVITAEECMNYLPSNENVGTRIIASNRFLEPDRNKNRQIRHWRSPARLLDLNIR